MEIKRFAVGGLMTNCYLAADDEKQAVLIDPGAEGEKLAGLVTDGGYALKAILLTHGHFDHIGAVDFLRERFRVPVLVHEADTELLSDGAKNGSLLFLDQNWTAGWSRVIGEGDILSFGGLSFEVLHTPGHSRGSVCFLLSQAGVLFSGDTLFSGGSFGRTDLYGGSEEALRRSIKRLGARLSDPLLICPGHGGPSHLSDERRQNPYLSGE